MLAWYDSAKMLAKYALGLASHIGLLVSASPVNLDSGSAVKTRDLNLKTLFQSNGSNVPLNITSSKDIHIQCDGAAYGSNLDIDDCEGAKTYLPAGADQVQWAERYTGWENKSFPLPYRAMGDKASCYFQPVLIDGATFAKATPDQVRIAAAAIRERCASDGRLQGGMATNIGKEISLLKVLIVRLISLHPIKMI